MRLPLLLLVCVALAVFVWYDYAPEKNDENTTVTAKSAQTTDKKKQNRQNTPVVITREELDQFLNPLKALKLTSLQYTKQRPLFTSTRRIPRKPVRRRIQLNLPKATPPRQPSLLLLGVIKDGKTSIALLHEKTTGRSLRVQVGDVIESWQVVKVSIKTVTMQNNAGQNILLKLGKN